MCTLQKDGWNSSISTVHAHVLDRYRLRYLVHQYVWLVSCTLHDSNIRKYVFLFFLLQLDVNYKVQLNIIKMNEPAHTLSTSEWDLTRLNENKSNLE
jgi:hypothetical protein